MNVQVESAPLAGGGQMMRADAQVSDAAMRDLAANPIEIVPAPAAPFFIDVIGVVTVLDTVAGAYAGGNNPRLGWADEAQSIEGAFDQQGVFTKGSGSSLDGPITIPAATAITLFSSDGGDLSGGDPANTLSIRMYYRIEPAAPFGA